MMPNCVRCNRPGFALIELKATIGRTKLIVSEQAERPALCAECVRSLVEWFKVGDQGDAADRFTSGLKTIGRQP